MSEQEPVFITPEQERDIAELRRGGDPGQVILTDWPPDESDQPSSSEPELIADGETPDDPSFPSPS